MATDLFAQLAAKDAENARLLAEVARQSTEIEHLRRELAHLRAASEVSHAQVGTLLQEMAKANERISELLAIAQRKAQAKKEKKVPEPGPPPATSEDQRTAFDGRLLPPPEPEPKKEPKKTGRNRRKAVPAHLETECGRRAASGSRGSF